jgi:hypothetical protein
MPVTFNETVTVPTKTKNSMLASLENPQTSLTRKELAKELLAWYAAEVAKPPLTGKSDLDRCAALMLVEFHADLLWRGSHRLEKWSVNGIETPVIVNIASNETINSYRA